MKTIKERKWYIYTLIGIYLILSPFPGVLGFPILIKDALSVILGAVTIWLSVVETE